MKPKYAGRWTGFAKTAWPYARTSWDAGVLSYGHPVRAGDGHVLYSIGITGLADRFHLVARTKIRQRLSEAAADLSRNLGFGG